MRRSSAFFVLLASCLAVPAPGEATVCHADPSTLCLADGRLRVHVTWTAEVEPAARPLGDTAGELSGDGGRSWLVVEAIDGRAENGHFWLLQSAPPEVEYELEVADLASGATQTYVKRDREPAVSDLVALRAGFPAADGALARAAREARDAPPSVTASARGEALEAAALDERTTVFRRAGALDPELVASFVDGRAVNGHWWLLAATPEGGEYELQIADREDGAPRRLPMVARGPATLFDDHAARAGAGIKVTLDTARAVKKSIGRNGGSLQATAANGTRFTLTIPAQGLLYREDITLTPLKSVQRLPFTPGLVGGVEIGPAGLRFAVGATLAIQPTPAVAPPVETTFAYRLGGAQFFLYPAALGQRPVELPVFHTGGYGLARATAAEQTVQLRRLPPRPEDQFEQKLWQVHRQLRQSPSAASGFVALAPAKAGSALLFYQDVYETSLRNTLDEIANSCDGRKRWGFYAQNFIAQALADGVYAQLGTQIAALRQALNRGAAKCYVQYGNACVVAKDHTAPVPALHWWRELQFAGATALVDPSLLAACLTFDLEFDSLVDHRNPVPDVHGTYLLSATHRLDTHVAIRFRPPFDFGTGSGPNGYVSGIYNGGAPTTCTIRATGRKQPETFRAYWLQLDVNLWEDNPPPPKLDLVYSIGDPKLELLETCSGRPEKFFVGLFAPAYLGLHLENKDFDLDDPVPPDINAYRLHDWIVQQSAVWAFQVYGRSVSRGNIHFHESTRFDLFHKPGS